jgi:hypothetical protein
MTPVGSEAGNSPPGQKGAGGNPRLRRSAPEDAGTGLLDRVEQRRDVRRRRGELVRMPAIVAAGGVQPPPPGAVVVAQP